MKISIITPSFNSGKSIEKAIKSVLYQDYTNYEHIIVDGGSKDETLDVLARYPHLKWISEPDRNQVHAMGKGFRMATGHIIGYLNADDYYLEGAFSSVIPHFKIGEKMVVGKVLVRSEKAGGIKEWTCDANTDFSAVIRHWENNAFCVNPVGYFYLREVQEKVPLREETGAKHDLEFLMETAYHFSIKKVDKVLGIFNHAMDTQTAREQLIPSYWQPQNFSFVNRLSEYLPEKEQKKFRLEQQRGYQLRRHWTVKEALVRGMAKELFEKKEIFLLPENDTNSFNNQCNFVEHNKLGTRYDWVVPVLTLDKMSGQSVFDTLTELNKNIFPVQIYQLNLLNEEAIRIALQENLQMNSRLEVDLSIKKLIDDIKNNLLWKFIAGVREPIAMGLSSYFKKKPHSEGNTKEIIEYLIKSAETSNNYFNDHYLKNLGIDIFDFKFDHEKKHTIICKGNIEILIYRFEDLPDIFPMAIEEYLGIKNVKLKNFGISSKIIYKEKYENFERALKFDKTFLENIYSSRMVKHFYRNEEIKSFMDKWIKKIPARDIAEKYRHINYYIYFVPRSGSTLLTELLLKTNVLGNPQEWFNPDCFAYYKKKYDYNPEEVETYLNRLGQEQRTGNGVFGIEIAYHQLKKYFDINNFFNYFDLNGKHIFVRRNNVLEQGYSLFRAFFTKVWHNNTGEQKDIGINIKYDSNALKDAIKTIIDEEVGLINFFLKNNINPLIVTYEELINNRSETIKKISKYVGVSLPGSIDFNNAANKKITTQHEYSEIMKKFQEENQSFIDNEMLRLNEARNLLSSQDKV